MSGSQSVTLQAKGLHTFVNPLGSSIPQGSFIDVSNVVVDRDGIIEPRRGFAQYLNSFGVTSDRTKQVFNYKDSILRHVLSELQFDLNGAFSTFAGESVNEIRSGLRMRGIEANGNFYFVTSTGVKKLSARSAADFPNISITDAGGVKALDVLAVQDYGSTYSPSGFLLPNSKTAYRVVWAYKDLNQNLILGSPSNSTIVFNNSLDSSAIVNINFSIPDSVTDTTFFYQVYRTAVFQGDIAGIGGATATTEPADPGDEMYLVIENNVTSTEITNGEVDTVIDITPESFRESGALLYTNPFSGDGVEQANERPPFANDIALYKQYTFYANTRTVHRFNLAYISMLGMTNNVSTISIADYANSILNTYTFQGSMESYTANFTGMLITNFYNSVAGPAKSFTLDAANDLAKYLIYYVKDAALDEVPTLGGRLGVVVEILGTETLAEVIQKTADAILTTKDFNVVVGTNTLTISCANNGYVTNNPVTTLSTFSITKDGLGTGEDVVNNKIFLPRIPVGEENGPNLSQQLEQIARSTIRVINAKDNIVYAYYNSAYKQTPGQILFERREIAGNEFQVLSSNGDQFNPKLQNDAATAISSTNEVSPNRVYYSKLQQPEAVPLVNYIDIGPKDREIKRIIALRDSLFVFKEDGIYRVSGTDAPFTVQEFDFSAQVLASDSATVLNNQIYALSTQGVITVSDTGVSVISRPIENQLLNIMRNGFQYKTASFGVAYETDRAYLLFLPTNVEDTVATQCLRFNIFTNTWTKWNVTATCGIVGFAENCLYIGAGDTNYVEKERKTLSRLDHADRQYDLTILENGVNTTTISVATLNGAEIGDALIQEQYLTGNEFNRLLIKLDDDSMVPSTNYQANFGFITGDNIRQNLAALATQLDTEMFFTNYAQSIGDYSYSVSSKTYDGTETKLHLTTDFDIIVGRFIKTDLSDDVYEVTSIYKDVGTSTYTINIPGHLPSTPTIIQTASLEFIDIQACYNIIVEKLNSDTHAFFTNYPYSEGTISFEAVISGVNKLTNKITVKTALDLMYGKITLYKAISSKVIWNPITFQDPSILKQVREGTMIFENSNFSSVTLSYATDLSPSFESITFEGSTLSIGDWGMFSFGNINWGGVSAPIPLRTLIPLEKQRCRFMNVKFEHRIAFEKYSIYGLSLTYRGISNRAYR